MREIPFLVHCKYLQAHSNQIAVICRVSIPKNKRIVFWLKYCNFPQVTTFWFVPLLVRALFGSCCFWFLLFLVCAHFSLCRFWLVLFLLCALFWFVPFMIVLFLVCAVFGHEPKR